MSERSETNVEIDRVVSYDTHEKEMLKVIAERDYWHDKATELAEAIGEHFNFDVGEHTSCNCPVQTAIEKLYEETHISIGDLSEIVTKADSSFGS